MSKTALPTFAFKHLKGSCRVVLKTAQRHVPEIAYEAVFLDRNYFSRAFHKEFGRVPGRARK